MLYPFDKVLEDFSRPAAAEEMSLLAEQKREAAIQAQREHERLVALEEERLQEQARIVRIQQSKVFDYEKHIERIALNQERYQQGYQQATERGRAENKINLDDLTTKYKGDFKGLMEQFRNEGEQREKIISQIADLFAQTIAFVIKKLLKAPEAEHFEGLKNDLLKEAKEIALAAQGDVSVECAPAQEERLKIMFKGEPNIEIIPSSDIVEGNIRIFSQGSRINIDPQQWQKKVADLVLSRVDNVMRSYQKGLKDGDQAIKNEEEHGGQ